MDGGAILCLKCRRPQSRLLARVRVGRKREVENVPEGWRVVTGRDGNKGMRPGGGITGYC